MAQINKFKNQNLVFTGCSKNLISRGNLSGRWETVYNAIDFKIGLSGTLPDEGLDAAWIEGALGRKEEKNSLELGK